MRDNDLLVGTIGDTIHMHLLADFRFMLSRTNGLGSASFVQRIKPQKVKT